MSVLIKNMTMPKNCIECPMQFGGWCYVCPPDIDERVAETVEEAVKQGKPDWCPLVEIEGDDVAPVTHGQWIWVGEKTVDGYTFDRYKCSNCGSVFLEYRSEDHHLRIASMILTGTVRTSCCPDCGTKMGEAVQV